MLNLADRATRLKQTSRGRGSDASASLALELRSLTHEVRVLGGLVRKIGAILKAQQPSVVIRPFVREDFERDIVKRFLEKSPRTTTALALEMGTYPKKVLRAIRRINRRVSKREGVEPFRFDSAKRNWQLELEIVDRKELV